MAEYEFTQEQNSKFDKLARVMVPVGILLVITGIVRLIDGALALRTESLGLDLLVDVLDAALIIAMGVVIYRPADNLKRIVSSAGSDIAELMAAVHELNSGFLAMGVLFVINIILLLVEFIAGGGVAGAP